MRLLPPLLLSLLALVLTSINALEQEEQTCSSSSSSDDPTCRDDAASDDATKISDITFEKAAQFQHFLGTIFDKVESHAASLGGNNKPNRQEQEQMILRAWLQYMNMNPKVITEIPLQQNWLYDLHQSTMALAPTQFFKIWDERARPTQDELDVLLSIDNSAYEAAMDSRTNKVDENKLMNHLIMPFRHRGFIMALLDTFTRVLMGPFKTISYGLLSPANLETIKQYSPLIEVGAGSGYWSAVLQQRGVDITPYDLEPPTMEGGKMGKYFDRQYTPVQQGDCQALFTSKQQTVNNHTLLMIWPNNPDNIDNAPAFYSSRLPPVWDTNCLQAFVKAGGTTIILVAERETNIHILPNHPQNPTQPDSGLCASRELQQALLHNFDLIQQMSVPTWYYSDDLTIWKLKKA